MSQTTSHTAAGPMAGIAGHREPARPIVRGATRSTALAGSGPVIAHDERRCEMHERRAPEHRYEPHTSPPAWGHLWVAEGTPPQFVIACKQCGRQLMVVVRITDPEIARLEAHIRACVRPDPLGEAPPLGALMAQIRVTAGGA